MYKLTKLKYKLQEYFRGYLKIYPAFLQANHVATTALIEQMARTERYQDNLRLLKFGAKSFSQSDEDGIIQEIFNRIGVTTKHFIEVGVGNGLENNTVLLLVQGWKGVWIDGSKANAKAIRRKFAPVIAQDQLRFHQSFVTKDNINRDIARLAHSKDVDLLSLDLDGNDFHIVEQIDAVRPRVVILEYNAKFIPPTDWVMAYNESHLWDGSDYFGASLSALEVLMDRKGYALVGCNITGTNGFFVQKELVGDKFRAPFTSANHYEPARYWAIPGFVSGQPANFGPFVSAKSR